MEALKDETTGPVTGPARLELVSPYVDEEDETAREGAWGIGSVAELDWALKRLGELEQRVFENQDVTKTRINELEDRCLRLNRPLEDGIRFFRRAIETYAETHRAELLGGGKRKSRALPHGSVGWRKRPASLEVVDNEALLEWARMQPVELGLVRIKEEPCLREILSVAGETGEVPPGMQHKPEAEVLQVKPQPLALTEVL